MQQVPLSKVPSQDLSVSLDGAYWRLRFYLSMEFVCVDISRNGETLITGVRCFINQPLLPYPYLYEPSFGNFIFDDDVDWESFDGSCSLYYLNNAEFKQYNELILDGYKAVGTKGIMAAAKQFSEIKATFDPGTGQLVVIRTQPKDTSVLVGRAFTLAIWCQFYNEIQWQRSPLPDGAAWTTVKTDSVATMGDSAFALTRDGDATYINSSKGISVAAKDAARFEGAPRFPDRRLIVEPARANLYTYSEQWGAGSRSNVTNNAATSPRGDMTMAFGRDDTSLAQEHYLQDRNIALTAGNVYVFSVFVKAPPTNARNLYLRVAAGSTSGCYFDAVAGNWVGNAIGAQFLNRGFDALADGVYRVWMAITAGATQSTVFRLQLANGTNPIYDGDGVSGLYVWGAQLEGVPASSQLPTSYIKTDANPVTRAADLFLPNVVAAKQHMVYRSLLTGQDVDVVMDYTGNILSAAAIRLIELLDAAGNVIASYNADNSEPNKYGKLSAQPSDNGYYRAVCIGDNNTIITDIVKVEVK